MPSEKVFGGIRWPEGRSILPDNHGAERPPMGENARDRQAYFTRKFQNPLTQSIPEQVRSRELAFADWIAAKTSTVASRLEHWVLIERGPYNLGGRTRALAVDVRNDSILLAGGVSGGMWRSEDQGRTWMLTSRPEQVPGVVALLQDQRPGHEDTWYYGTGEYIGNTANGVGAPARGDGLFVSHDNGQSWDALINTSSLLAEAPEFEGYFSHVHSMAQDYSNRSQTEMYVAVPHAILRSEDGFETFSAVLRTNEGNGEFSEVMVTPSGRVFATLSNEQGDENANTGILVSENGKDWENITPPTGYEDGYRRIIMAHHPVFDQEVYFYADTRSGPRLHRYSVGTNTWEELSLNLPAFGGQVGNLETQRSYNMVLEIHPDDPNVIFIGGRNLFRSTSGFRDDARTTWVGGYNPSNNFAQYPDHHSDQHALVFTSTGDMISGHDGGISLSQNAKSSNVIWRSLNRGYHTTQAYSVSQNTLDFGDPIRLVGMQDNGTYGVDDPRSTALWEPVETGDGGHSAVTPTSLLVSRQFGQLTRYPVQLRSGVISEIALDLALPNAGSSAAYKFVTPWIIDPLRPNRVIVAGLDALWINEDVSRTAHGSEWSFAPTEHLEGEVSALAMAESEPQLWVGTDQGVIYRVSNHLQQELIFDEVSGALFPRGGYISSLAVHPQDENQVWVTFSNYGVESVFYTQDGGVTWQAVGGNLDQPGPSRSLGPSVSHIALLPHGNQTYCFLGTSIGLFYAEEMKGRATEWIPLGQESIGRAVVDHLQVNPTDGTVIVGTHGKGVYEFQVDVGWQPRVIVLGSDPLCGSNELVTLVASRVTDDQEDIKYQWYKDGEPVSSHGGYTLETQVGGNYHVSIQRLGDTALYVTPTVQLQGPIAPMVVLSQRNDTLQVENPCEGCVYEWLRNGEQTLALTSQPYYVIKDLLSTAEISVAVSNGCAPIQSNPVKVVGYDAPSGQLLVFPNPVVHLAKLGVVDQPGPVLGARLLSTLGQELGHQQGDYWDRWNLSDLPPGKYIMQVYGADFITATVLEKQ